MNASSGERLFTLAMVETKQVQCLLRVLSRSNMRRMQFVEMSYVEQARNFRETLQFLKDIGWVREQEDELVLTDDGETAGKATQDDARIRNRLVEALIAEASPYQGLVADYLAQFKMTDSDLVCRSPIRDRLQKSPVRNFLMDVGVVTYRAADDLHVLEGNSVELYVWARNVKRATSRNQMQIRARRKEDLGFAAELTVLNFERNRVGEMWASKVEHVSAKNPFACFDIKSVTVQTFTAVPRYVEVKAVSGDTYQFYWTASEVEAAQSLRTKYFLYLLPVVPGGGFDPAQILLIEDPYISVYQNSQSWVIEENAIICRRRQP